MSMLANVRLAVRRQEGVSDCAAACTAMLLEAFGHPVEMRAIRETLETDGRIGATAESIVDYLVNHNIEAWGTFSAPGDLTGVQPPAILHWRTEHFVILERIGASHVDIIDPLWGARRSLTFPRLRLLASGLVLHARPL